MSVYIIIQILHRICRIAEVLLALQEIGNVNYTGWRLQVPCLNNKLTITRLQDQARIMEHDLCEWKEVVDCKREEFYELNYFNTMQLLSLREEFGKVKLSEGMHAVSPEALAVLQSISSQITAKMVSDAVCDVLTKSTTPSSVAEQVFECASTVESDALKSEQSPNLDSSKCKTTISIDSLTDSQKEMVTNISFKVSCSKQLVLMSFEHLGLNGKEDQFDYERWCIKNSEMDDSEDDDSETDLESISSSQPDSEETGICCTYIEIAVFTPTSERGPFSLVLVVGPAWPWYS